MTVQPENRIADYVAERIIEFERQSKTTARSFQDTAKWIISGIALATAGAIAGTSLSSLGALGVGLRLSAAIAALVIGYICLGILFSYALTVIAPRDHTLWEISNGKEMPAGWPEEIESDIRPYLWPKRITNLKDFCDFVDDPKHENGAPLSDEELRNFNMARRRTAARAELKERELQFRRLKHRTFAITPLIALASIVFAWAANPAKEELRRVPSVETAVDVDQSDVPVLRNAFGNPVCVVPMLHVIVLGEWPSGVQDVVTVPVPGCPPLRLRLDHGRLSQAQ